MKTLTRMRKRTRASLRKKTCVSCGVLLWGKGVYRSGEVSGGFCSPRCMSIAESLQKPALEALVTEKAENPPKKEGEVKTYKHLFQFKRRTAMKSISGKHDNHLSLPKIVNVTLHSEMKCDPENTLEEAAWIRFAFILLKTKWGRFYEYYVRLLRNCYDVTKF